MPELSVDFQSLPPEYQQVIQLAEEQHNITIAPLQLLVGGWSGAVVYLVSVSYNDTKKVEHCILKLDRKSKRARSDEVTRHNTVLDKSTPQFAHDHIAELAFDRVEYENAIAIFYRVAGQSLLNYLPLSKYERQSQLKTIFVQTNYVLLNEWNAKGGFEQAVHPQKVLEKWLGFRLNAGGNIETFLQTVPQVNPNIEGFLVNGHIFPNPLLYARDTEPWGKARTIDVATGSIHGDLNTNNILVKFSNDKVSLEGYYLIDFALFKENMPLLYDQRYLEMSYLMLAMSQVTLPKSINYLTLLAAADSPDPNKVPIEMSGVSTVIGSARGAFSEWVEANHPSLHDDLWGQYWLAGVAAGLTYCHKAGLSDEQRLAGLIYSAANLRRYAAMFDLNLPTDVELLYDENKAAEGLPRKSKAKKHRHNLPAQPTPFIGRATLITMLKELALNPDIHLITLMGPGGTGKTRLSLQVAQELLDQFTDGVFFVPLADDKDTDQFVSRLAKQLPVRESGRPLLEEIKDFLRDKNLLLVLDNFEQLVSAAPVVAELLAEAPRLKAITSSRIALNLQGEHEFPVPPLELPQTSGVTPENLAGNESVRLFVERARAIGPNFALTEDNAAAIAEICRRLDGLPLALELAAARIKLLQPGAILARLDNSLKLLTGGARDLPARQQTLRNTLDWSHSLLSPEEKTLFARLGIFVGGFSLDAAEAVCNSDGSLDFLNGVESLLNNSLLRQEQAANGQTRFKMLETIREYALEQLDKNSELVSLKRAHALFFINKVVSEIGFKVFSESATWLDWLEIEHDNIRATLVWGQTSQEVTELVSRMIFFLTWFWARRGYYSEGRSWTEWLLTCSADSGKTRRRAEALQCNAQLAEWQGDANTALPLIEECLSIWEQLEYEPDMPLALMTLGNIHVNMGNDALAYPILKEARAIFQKWDNVFFKTLILVTLGNVALGMGNPAEARDWLEEAYNVSQESGDNWMTSFALDNLGEVARVQGDYNKARGYYHESETLLRAAGEKGDLPRLVHNLGYIALHEGDFEAANAQFRESLMMFKESGHKRGIAESLAGLAGLSALQGQLGRGAQLLGAAEAQLAAIGGVWWPADRVEIEQNRRMIVSELGEADFKAEHEKGSKIPLSQILANVLD
jgi:predicted ATPase